MVQLDRQVILYENETQAINNYFIHLKPANNTVLLRFYIREIFIVIQKTRNVGFITGITETDSKFW